MQNQFSDSHSVLSIGMDVDKQKSVVVVLDVSTGEIVFEGTVPHKRESWEKLLQRLPQQPLWACYETGSLGFWLCRMLRDMGVRCNVVASTAVPKEPERRQRKNDQLDALTLALMYLHPPRSFVRIPTTQEEDDRELIRTREQLVKQRIRAVNQIRAKLRFHGISIDETIDSRSKRWLAHIRDLLPTGSSLQLAVASLLTLLETLNKEIQLLERGLRELSRTDRFEQTSARLERIAGVGPLTSMAFLTEVYRPGDFPSSDKLMSHLGLVPTEWSSGASIRHGHITRWGPSHLRRLLVEAAWEWVRRDSDAKELYEHLCRGRLRKKAIVAMARRLATAMWAMTVKEEEYNFHWNKAA